MNPRLDVENVSVAYANGHLALHDASFHLTGGTICALVGVNGSGKSTLFKSIMGFVKPTSGSARINGQPILSSPARLPATEKDWQGVPPARRSIAPTSSAPIFVKSPALMTAPSAGRATTLRMAAARCFASFRVGASWGLGMWMGRDAP